MRVEPIAPSALQGHLRVGRPRGHRDDGENQRKEDHGLVQHAAAIALIERIEHAAVPYVQPVLNAEIPQRNGDHREGEQPGRLPAALLQKPRAASQKRASRYCLVCCSSSSDMVKASLAHGIPVFSCTGAT